MGSVTSIKKADSELVEILQDLLDSAKSGLVVSVAGAVSHGDGSGGHFYAGVDETSTDLVVDLQYVTSDLSGQVARSRNE